jgi:hypothetical protein
MVETRSCSASDRVVLVFRALAVQTLGNWQIVAHDSWIKLAQRRCIALPESADA